METCSSCGAHYPKDSFTSCPNGCVSQETIAHQQKQYDDLPAYIECASCHTTIAKHRLYRPNKTHDPTTPKTQCPRCSKNAITGLAPITY